MKRTIICLSMLSAFIYPAAPAPVPPLFQLFENFGRGMSVELGRNPQARWRLFETQIRNILNQDPEAINARNQHGETALHVAARTYLDDHYAQIAELLIMYGIDVDAVDNDGSTALLLAVFRSDAHAAETMVKLLTQHDADPTIANQYGQTPLAELNDQIARVRRVKRVGPNVVSIMPWDSTKKFLIDAENKIKSKKEKKKKES